MSEHTTDPHEDIHLPAPSAAPIVVAAGMTLALTGIVSPVLLLLGVLLLAVGIGMWAFGKR